jgi:hypothetical protein
VFLFDNYVQHKFFYDLGILRMKKNEILGCFIDFLIRPKFEINEKILDFYNKNFLNKYVIGVHGRTGEGTGEQLGRYKDFDFLKNWLINCSLHVEKVMFQKFEKKEIKFFLVSDSLTLKKQFSDHFKKNNKVIIYDSQHYFTQDSALISDYKSVEDMVVEHALLAKANFGISSLSGFSDTAQMIGNHPKYKLQDEVVCNDNTFPSYNIIYERLAMGHNF